MIHDIRIFSNKYTREYTCDYTRDNVSRNPFDKPVQYEYHKISIYNEFIYAL